MKLPVALAIVVGVVGGILTWLYVGPLSGLGLFVPATFLGAASYFAAGGNLPALKKSLPANVWGVVMGTITLVLASLVTSSVLIGVIVGGMTGIMILGALVPALDFVPGHVVAFAMTVGWGLLTTESPLGLGFPVAALVVMLISFVVGGLYGWVGSILVGRLVGTAPAPAAAR